MSNRSEMTTVKCSGCQKPIKVPKNWVDFGKVTHLSCSRACEIKHARDVAERIKKKELQP
jgi:hypothetical protein